MDNGRGGKFCHRKTLPNLEKGENVDQKRGERGLGECIFRLGKGLHRGP